MSSRLLELKPETEGLMLDLLLGLVKAEEEAGHSIDASEALTVTAQRTIAETQEPVAASHVAAVMWTAIGRNQLTLTDGQLWSGEEGTHG